MASRFLPSPTAELSTTKSTLFRYLDEEIRFEHSRKFLVVQKQQPKNSLIHQEKHNILTVKIENCSKEGERHHPKLKGTNQTSGFSHRSEFSQRNAIHRNSKGPETTRCMRTFEKSISRREAEQFSSTES